MASDPGASFADPAAWINLGTAGLFLFAFLTGKIYSQTTLSKIEDQRDKAVASAETRERRLTEERDRALAERDEMVEVIKDFTHTASAILNITGAPWKPARTPRRVQGGEPR